MLARALVCDPDVLLLATGSEVSVALCAAEGLGKDGIKAQVVSMPCWELFEKQDQAYQDSVMAPSCTKRVVVEAGTSFGWERYVNRCGLMITKDDFGASGPFTVLQEKFGFTTENVYEKTKALLNG